MANKLHLSIAIALISIIVFIPTITFQFTNWDDDKFIIFNPDVKSLTIKSVTKIFTSFYEGGYQPLTQLSFAVDYAIGKLNPAIYHAVNVMWHTFNAVMLWHILLALRISTTIALITTIIWSIHPLRVESVVWISERKDVLFGFFYLAALLCYVKGYIRRSWLLFVLACLAKHQAATLCLVLPLVDWYQYRHRDILIKRLYVYVFFALTGAVFLLITIFKAKGYWTNLGMYNPLDKMILASFASVIYATKTIIPYQLSALYPYPAKVNGWFPWYVYVMPLIPVGVFAVAWVKRSQWPIVLLGIGFFAFNLLLPLATIVSGGYFVFDRYTYLPSIGLLLIMAHFIVDGLSHRFKIIYYIIVLLAAGTYAMITVHYSRVWKDGISLWTEVIRQYPLFPIIYDNRGTALYLAHRDEEALADFSKAIMLNPNYPGAYNNRASIYLKQQHYAKAIDDLNQAILHDPQYAIAYFNRGLAHFHQNSFKAAYADLSYARQLGVVIDDNFMTQLQSLQIK